MDKLQKDVVIIALMEKLKEHESWCGETHVQKSTYFLQELTGVDLGFDFILYKHGPYSFDLTDEFASMRADGLLKIVVQPAPYGPSLLPTDAAADLKERYPKTLRDCSVAIDRIATLLGGKGVAELERLATALYVSRNVDDHDPDALAKSIVELKPHINHAAALNAVKTVQEWNGKP